MNINRVNKNLSLVVSVILLSLLCILLPCKAAADKEDLIENNNEELIENNNEALIENSNQCLIEDNEELIENNAEVLTENAEDLIKNKDGSITYKDVLYKPLSKDSCIFSSPGDANLPFVALYPDNVYKLVTGHLPAEGDKPGYTFYVERDSDNPTIFPYNPAETKCDFLYIYVMKPDENGVYTYYTSDCEIVRFKYSKGNDGYPILSYIDYNAGEKLFSSLPPPSCLFTIDNKKYIRTFAELYKGEGKNPCIFYPIDKSNRTFALALIEEDGIKYDDLIQGIRILETPKGKYSFFVSYNWHPFAIKYNNGQCPLKVIRPEADVNGNIFTFTYTDTDNKLKIRFKQKYTKGATESLYDDIVELEFVDFQDL